MMINLFMVGEADIRNISDFERVYKGCDIFKLEKNYRSTANILDVAYSVVRNNVERAPKETFLIIKMVKIRYFRDKRRNGRSRCIN